MKCGEEAKVEADAEQAKLAIKALRTTMAAPDKLTANRETLDCATA